MWLTLISVLRIHSQLRIFGSKAWLLLLYICAYALFSPLSCNKIVICVFQEKVDIGELCAIMLLC